MMQSTTRLNFRKIHRQLTCLCVLAVALYTQLSTCCQAFQASALPVTQKNGQNNFCAVHCGCCCQPKSKQIGKQTTAEQKTLGCACLQPTPEPLAMVSGNPTTQQTKLSFMPQAIEPLLSLLSLFSLLSITSPQQSMLEQAAWPPNRLQYRQKQLQVWLN